MENLQRTSSIWRMPSPFSRIYIQGDVTRRPSDVQGRLCLGMERIGHLAQGCTYPGGSSKSRTLRFAHPSSACPSSLWQDEVDRTTRPKSFTEAWRKTWRKDLQENIAIDKAWQKCRSSDARRWAPMIVTKSSNSTAHGKGDSNKFSTRKSLQGASR